MAFHLLKDGVDRNTVATIPENGNFKSVGASFIGKLNPFSYNEDKLFIEDGCAIDLFDGNNWLQIPNRGRIEFDPAASLDSGSSFMVGLDYFIYLCKSGSGDPQIVVSVNATFPDGFSADNSRKIGGFHYGTIRRVSTDGKWVPVDSNGVKFGNSGTKWQDNVTIGIIPNSIWDLKNRPRTLFGGLVKIGHLWVSIYQASAKQAITFMGGTNGLHVAEGELQSKYGELPVTGTEGLNQYNFVELAGRSDMRLLTYREWLEAAYGSPQGEDGSNNYGWTNTGNSSRTRTGCKVNPTSGNYDIAGGVKPYAISARNVVDCVGNVWEWLSDCSIRADMVSYSWYNVLGDGMGQVYGSNQFNPMIAVAGANWANGVACGPRAILLYDFAYNISTHVSSRLACDAA
jgi:formylglycine-generating enzyme required for sulfatase activity